MLDNKKLAVIHIVKRELNLSDQEYRDTLEKVTGSRTARDLDPAGFLKLMRYFARSRYYKLHPAGITFRQKLYIKHLAADLEWDHKHFVNFLKKYYHHGDLAQLTKVEGSKLIESLKNVARHQGSPL